MSGPPASISDTDSNCCHSCCDTGGGRGSSKEQRRRRRQLCLLTLCYVLGELGHFLISVTSRDVAREVHYGDRACFLGSAEDEKVGGDSGRETTVADAEGEANVSTTGREEACRRIENRTEYDS